MSNIGIGPNYPGITPSYSPLGKPAAGLESAENKDQTLPPVEEGSAAEKNRHQPDHKTAAVSDEERGGEHGRRQSNESAEAEPQKEQEPAAPDLESAASEAVQILALAQLDAVLQRTAALHAGEPAKADYSAAVGSFESNAGHTHTPGSLLDQHS